MKKEEIINDLYKNNYKEKYESLKLENTELKKRTKEIRRKIRDTENQLRKK